MEVGHAVTVWNRSADKVKPLAAVGAKAAASPADEVSCARVITATRIRPRIAMRLPQRVP